MLNFTIQDYIQLATQHIETFLHIIVNMSLSYFTGTEICDGDLSYRALTLISCQQYALHASLMGCGYWNNAFKRPFHFFFPIAARTDNCRISILL